MEGHSLDSRNKTIFKKLRKQKGTCKYRKFDDAHRGATIKGKDKRGDSLINNGIISSLKIKKINKTINPPITSQTDIDEFWFSFFILGTFEMVWVVSKF